MTARLAWPDITSPGGAPAPESAVVPLPDAHDDGRDVLAALDLNVLPALRALLQERSVTRAAARLGLRQPAASAALRRLRIHFGDPLLIRTGNTFELSPLAAALLTQVERALDAAQAVLLERPTFDAASSRRRFTVKAADSDLMLVGQQIVRRLADSPGITLDVIPLSASTLHDIERTIRGVDLLLLPRDAITGYPSMSLWTDEWVFVVGDRSPIEAHHVTPELLGAMAWVEPFGAASLTATALEAWGVQPHVQVCVPSSALLPMLLRDSTRHAALLPRRVAQRLSRFGGIRVLECPIPSARLQMAQWWHPARDDDAGHAWLRNLVRQAASDLHRPSDSRL